MNHQPSWEDLINQLKPLHNHRLDAELTAAPSGPARNRRAAMEFNMAPDFLGLWRCGDKLWQRCPNCRDLDSLQVFLSNCNFK